VSASAVARKVGPKTRAVMVNSPSNPTGAVIEPGELLKLARLAKQRGFWLLYDDTYAHLTFGKNGPQPLQEVKDAAGGHLVVVGTASKSYCMTGWRIGWIIGPKGRAGAPARVNPRTGQGGAT